LGTGDLFVTGTAGVTSIILKEIPEDINYILGILNSQLISYYVIKHSPVFQGGYHKFSSNYLKPIPIVRIDQTKSKNKQMHDRICELVERQLSFSARLGKIGDRLTDERQKIEEEIRKTDVEIDDLVFRIYGLTENEQRIVKNSLEQQNG
jgi:hypothetical protein